MAYKRFTVIRGHPRKMWSDAGTNFIGAKSVLEESAANNGMEWTWKIHPADSPHRNGAAETAVCVVKKALQSLRRESSLSYSEFQTTLYMAANLANDQPTDAVAQSQEDCIQYVTPNTTLLVPTCL